MRPIYLDNAATSFPKPPRVYEKLREYLEKYGGCPGRGSHQMARQADSILIETRKALAELFNIKDPNRIAFTLNATDALNMAIKGALKQGDHVVTSVTEHNSVNRPLNGLEKKGLIKVSRVGVSKEGVVDPKDVQNAITKNTKLVAIVHGSNVSGALNPISEIGRIVRSTGTVFLVDAAQTAGCVPINVEEDCIDLLAFPGHKALLGLPGTGALYAGERAKLSPWREGGTGILSELEFQPDEFPYLLEAGSPNTLGLAGLLESVRFILQYGVSWIRKHELSLTSSLIQGLEENDRVNVYGPVKLENRISVVSINIKGLKPLETASLLDEKYGIGVRAGLHCAPGAHKAMGTLPDGSVRISPGYFNDPSDIQKCIDAIAEISASVKTLKSSSCSYA